jgi:outer membrane receptor protein involved in Fe transport
MALVKSRLRARRTTRFAALFGTASCFAMSAYAADVAAPAAPAAPGTAPVEEVLITGSLIRGAPAIGVPVTAVGEETFRETGALTITDVMKTIPAIDVDINNSVTGGGGNIQRHQNVQIHGLGTGSGVETLLLVNNMRFPAQGHGGDNVDPNIIPQLAVDHVDVLAAGASATYGSDAVAGVINVVLRRGYDGAITQGRFSVAPGFGGRTVQFSQLYGTSWDSGNVTVTYEFYEEAPVRGVPRDYFTFNFERWGLNDVTPLAVNQPGVVTTGAPAAPAGVTLPTGYSPSLGTRYCANCYSLPVGLGWNFGDQAPGPTTNWTALLNNKGVRNERNPYEKAWITPYHQRNGGAITFDQDLIDDLFGFGWVQNVSLFADAFYSNRRSVIYYPASASPGRENVTPSGGVTVPTNNPYFPTGAPSGIRIHYSLSSSEMPVRVAAGEIAGRWDFGFNFDLPFDWNGRAFYSKTEDQNFAHARNMTNRNMFAAALGQTIASVAASGTVPGQAAFTKPANIPFFNPFCDTDYYRCNSEQTLNYIRAFRNYDEKWVITQYGINLDGPVFELPGGPVMVAVAAENVSNHFKFVETSNFNRSNTALITSNAQYEKQLVYAFMGEVSVPVFGEDFSFPLMESLTLQAAYRYDRYYVLGGVETPKVSIDWGVGYGLRLRGTWGKAFRAPSFSESSTYSGVMIDPGNIVAGGTGNTVVFNCGPPGTTTAPAGSATALLNPNCNPALFAPAGILVSGGAGGARPIRPGFELGPEDATNWSAGFNFTPTEGFLAGLMIDVTYFKLRIDDLIAQNNVGTGPNDPASLGSFIIAPDPSLPNLATNANAPFLAMIEGIIAQGRFNFDPAIAPNVKFIRDTAITNIGWRELSGIDFDSRYDVDLGNWGSWNIGATGYYELTDRAQGNPFVPVDDVYEGKNSGHRLKRVRYRIGWTDAENAWNATFFVNYRGHSSVPEGATFIPPPCHWAPGFGPGSCYPGSGYVGPHEVFPNYHPANYLFDLTVGYNTGERPMNPYLQNLSIQLTIFNLLDRRPPFEYDARAQSGVPRAYNVNFNPAQRVVALNFTKMW